MANKLIPPSTTNTVPGIQRQTQPLPDRATDTVIRNIYDNLYYLRNQVQQLLERVGKLESK